MAKQEANLWLNVRQQVKIPFVQGTAAELQTQGEVT